MSFRLQLESIFAESVYDDVDLIVVRLTYEFCLVKILCHQPENHIIKMFKENFTKILTATTLISEIPDPDILSDNKRSLSGSDANLAASDLFLRIDFDRLCVGSADELSIIKNGKKIN
jgi:hypothetical protein